MSILRLTAMKISLPVSHGFTDRSPTRQVAQPSTQTQAGSADRPVRISRAPEEAALFAYNRQAAPAQPRPAPQIDEYV
ncbi:MAG: hypothetical protein AAF993_15025 [Pseudomonadota bacterium]